jgi:histidinol-phosphate/aromatic aminotransferase/cobyric acid decarboxylase-like protein
MDPLRHVKPAVRALSAYTLARREAPVKLNQNENPWDLPEPLKRRVLEQALARPWSRYPEFDPRELLEALARFSGFRPDGILAGNGSNELIEALLLVTVGPGTKVVIPQPTFTLYALLTTILGGEPVTVPMRCEAQAITGGAAVRRADGGTGASACAAELISERSVPSVRPLADAPRFSYDLEALIGARRASRASVVVVCSPNNPTGTSLPLAGVERLCAESDALVVLDEAYHEFSGQSAVPLLERHPNLVVLRTFSKAMALAGLRVGYLLASPELVREVNKARLPYNVNFLSQAAAVAAIGEYEGALAPTVRRLVGERERLLARLADVPGVRAFASDANFFLLECTGVDPKAVFAALLRRGVLVRDVTSYPMLSRFLRVSVGSEAENDAFLHALGTALTEAGMDLTTGRA